MRKINLIRSRFFSESCQFASSCHVSLPRHFNIIDETIKIGSNVSSQRQKQIWAAAYSANMPAAPLPCLADLPRHDPPEADSPTSSRGSNSGQFLGIRLNCKMHQLCKGCAPRGPFLGKPVILQFGGGDYRSLSLDSDIARILSWGCCHLPLGKGEPYKDTAAASFSLIWEMLSGKLHRLVL